jgi:hypothetical protein
MENQDQEIGFSTNLVSLRHRVKSLAQRFGCLQSVPCSLHWV